MPSFVRLLLSGAVGVLVCWLLVSGAGAQPGTPGYPTTLTPSATPQGAATATGSTAAQVAAPNSATIAGGRGRIANVRDRGFTVLWTTDADVPGQVNHGPSASLGTTATDQRGPAFSGRTHYVEIGGLTPSTTYFFDLVSGGAVDNNGGQHYQIRTGPELAGGPPLGNSLLGTVLQPGGGAPAGGALVWAVVRDANSQGSSGSSQVLGVLSAPDGRFQIGLQPRLSDLSGYFEYSTEGDLVEASARHEAGAVDQGLNTAVTQGGSSPNNVQLVLVATPGAAAATATPTRTNTPAAGVATVAPTSTPVRTAAPAVAPQQPPVGAPAAATAVPTAVIAAPLQLPALREMALEQGYPLPGQQGVPGIPTPVPGVPGIATPVPGVPGGAYPGAGAPVQPGPATKPGQVGSIGSGAVAPQPAQPAAPPPTVPGSTAPGAQPATKAPGAAAPTVQQPGAALPPGVQPGPTTPVGVVPGAPGTINPVAPGTKPEGTFGQQPAGYPAAPAPPVGLATAVAPSPAPLNTLANLPPLISGLFYGGIMIVALGGGLAIWSVLNGTGWRAR